MCEKITTKTNRRVARKLLEERSHLCTHPFWAPEVAEVVPAHHVESSMDHYDKQVEEVQKTYRFLDDIKDQAMTEEEWNDAEEQQSFLAREFLGPALKQRIAARKKNT